MESAITFALSGCIFLCLCAAEGLGCCITLVNGEVVAKRLTDRAKSLKTWHSCLKPMKLAHLLDPKESYPLSLPLPHYCAPLKLMLLGIGSPAMAGKTSAITAEIIQP